MAFIVANAGLEGLATLATAEELPGLGDAWDALWDASAVNADVILYGETTSALEVLRELCLTEKVAEWGAVWAITQTSGRGQFRRPWVSLRGNLHAAWRWPLVEPPGDDLVPLAVGVATVRALRRFGVSASLKWPNDLLLGPRKLGGLLVERYLDFVLVGLGLNVCAAPALAQLHPAAAIPATCLSDHGLAFDLGSFWDELCEEGKPMVSQLGTEAGRSALRVAHAKFIARGFEDKGS
ncbi:MAG: hypothetical protein MUC50_21775 [Myxococcota bacterium]|jgi:BirA family biotin operon repressor/biotin-[acetyl-CoA-carboxylase] ligase|nr:hypothetical protein [Myxococcota bacterium]